MSADTAPAAMPGVEEIARLLFTRSVYHGYDKETLKCEWTRTEGIHRDNARAILDLFAPILAEKEREITTFENREAEWNEAIAVSLQNEEDAHRKLEAAEAALAAERERCALIAERYDQSPGDDSVMGPVMAGQVAVAQSIATAIRSGEAP